MNSRDQLEKAVVELTESARTNTDDPSLRKKFARSVTTFGAELILRLEFDVLKKYISEGKTFSSVLLMIPEGRIRDRMLNNLREDPSYLQSITKSAVDAVDLMVLAPHNKRLQFLLDMIGNRYPDQIITNNKELTYFHDNLAHEDRDNFLEYFSSKAKNLGNYQIEFSSEHRTPESPKSRHQTSHVMFAAREEKSPEPSGAEPIDNAEKRRRH